MLYKSWIWRSFLPFSQRCRIGNPNAFLISGSVTYHSLSYTPNRLPHITVYMGSTIDRNLKSLRDSKFCTTQKSKKWPIFHWVNVNPRTYQSVILMRECIVIFFTHLLYGSNFLFHKEKDANIFQQETFHEFRKEATNQVNSSLPSFWTWAKGAASSHLWIQFLWEWLMESFSTQSPLPYYHVKHEEDESDVPFSNDDCDSSLNSYDSFQLMQSDHLHDTD
jgi:hypothetical protein